MSNICLSYKTYYRSLLKDHNSGFNLQHFVKYECIINKEDRSNKNMVIEYVAKQK